MTLTVGEWKTLNISADADIYSGNTSLSYQIANETIVGAMWDDWDSWDGKNMSLYVNGLAAGSTIVTIQLLGSNGEVLASEALLVTVSAPAPSPTPPPIDVALNAEQIYARCAPAVFYIEVYNKSGQMLGSGSGVFLSEDGLAITNHHVVEDAYSAKIQTTDGKVYNVSGYYEAKEAIDMALIQIDGSGFSYMEIGDSKNIAGGQSIFTIGSPLGLDNTISTGIISNPNRVLGGLGYIQISAPISHGSSGGALINDKGQLIGITSAGFDDGQNLNLAVPIHRMNELSTANLYDFPLGGSSNGDSGDVGVSLSFASNLNVTLGSTETLRITTDSGSYNDIYLTYSIGNENIVSAQWDSWEGNEINLYVTGKSVGSTTITIRMYTADDRLLLTETGDVTVQSVAAPTDDQAFLALKNWIKNNYTQKLSSGAMLYTEIRNNGNTKYEYSLILYADEKNIDARVISITDLSEVTTFIDLSTDSDNGFVSIYSYYTEGSHDDLMFEGDGYVQKASFCENSYFDFTYCEGDTANLSTYKELAKLGALMALMFTDQVLAAKLPQYSIADFGYTNIYN